MYLEKFILFRAQFDLNHKTTGEIEYEDLLASLLVAILSVPNTYNFIVG